ncbi:hypothetical protein [Roseovarius sp. ZX-A-9]|uniref:hypothetical protein n=1 Tax=Roseovarius sp. ZX-A-9 TaxID=3014783 RepID=UPI00232A98AA|nr:hypothetical protein [Roseovarius sp. ZX-A-9]
MFRYLSLALSTLLVAPLPAEAQDLEELPYVMLLEELTNQLRAEDPALRVQGGLAACLGTFEAPTEPDQTASVFEFMEWNAGGTYGGLVEFDYLDSMATVADDGAFCEISDMTLSQTEAAEVVFSTFAEMGAKPWPQSQTEAGCTAFTSPAGRVIVITSAGQDPICGDTPDSAIRVWNQEAQ